MKKYVVGIHDKQDNEALLTICETDNDLSLLLSHLDANRYDLMSVNVLIVAEDWKEFCKKDNLEKGS